MEEPVQILAHIQCVCTLVAMMEHNQGANYITAGKFTLPFWKIFPGVMKYWLQEDHNLDPFDATNPMNHKNTADQMQRYWNIHFKRSKKN